MAREITFEDTVKADSERDAVIQIYRLYPNAIDVELISRETADGTQSARGRYFVFEITMEQEEKINLAPENLGEEELY